MTLTERFFSCETLLGIIATAALTGCAQPQMPMREIDPQADPILRQMCKTLDGARAFCFRVHAATDRPVETGQLAQFHRTSEITMVRPDRLYAKTDSDDGKWSVWYRGRKLTVFDRDANMYAVENVPGRVDRMIDYMADTYDVIMPMADLLAGNTYDSLLADVEEGYYVGLHAVGDTKCHHLLFRQENLDWQIWIDAGNRPLPRKLVITYTQEPDQPQYVATIDNWDLAPTVSKDTFTFAAPASAKSVTMADLIEQK